MEPGGEAMNWIMAGAALAGPIGAVLLALYKFGHMEARLIGRLDKLEDREDNLEKREEKIEVDIARQLDRLAQKIEDHKEYASRQRSGLHQRIEKLQDQVHALSKEIIALKAAVEKNGK